MDSVDPGCNLRRGADCRYHGGHRPEVVSSRGGDLLGFVDKRQLKSECYPGSSLVVTVYVSRDSFGRTTECVGDSLFQDIS